MKAKTIDSTTTVYDGTGFSALVVGHLAPGSDVEVLAVKKQDGRKWMTVKLPDGRMGFVSGEAKIVWLTSREKWKTPDGEDAKRSMQRGALWLGGGVLVTAVTLSAASSSRQGGIVVIAWGPVLFGGFRFLVGLLQYLYSLSD
jgi:hypothetical protein